MDTEFEHLRKMLDKIARQHGGDYWFKQYCKTRTEELEQIYKTECKDPEKPTDVPRLTIEE